MGNKSKMKEGQVELSICFGDGFTDLHLYRLQQVYIIPNIFIHLLFYPYPFQLTVM